MPAVSEKQRRFFGLVRAIQKGEGVAGGASGAAKRAARTMTSKQVRELARKKAKSLS